MCSGRRSATLPRQRGAVSARAQGLGQVWHARGTVQCAVEVDPLREERATGVLDGCLFTRRLRWHAVRAAAGLHKVGVHPVDGVRARLAPGSVPPASRPGAAVPADADYFEFSSCARAHFAGRTAFAAGATVDSNYRSTRSTALR